MKIIYRYHKITTRLPKWIKAILYFIWEKSHYLKGKVKINDNPIFLFGYQKAGTTAISVLFSEATGLSVTAELKKQLIKPQYKEVYQGDLGFDRFIEINKIDFSKEVIKENYLIFYFKQLIERFPNAKSVFIVRDPRDNIRSILNRLNLSGDQQKKSDIKNLPMVWRQFLDNKWLTGKESENYIEALAYSWQKAADIYKLYENNMILIRYEDFLKEKTKVINEICKTLECEIKKDITPLVDVKYNLAGNKNVVWEKFYGMKNLDKINEICAEGMKFFNYAH